MTFSTKIVRRSDWRATLFIVVGLTLTACGSILAQNKETIPPLGTATPTLPPLPTLDSTESILGQRVYVEQCAVCHGPNGEGQPNWKQPDANGNRPAPPHDDTGHTWHHADGLLYEIICDGFRDPLKPPDRPMTMSAFHDKLTDAEIRAVITYLKSLCSEQSRLFQWQVTQQQPLPTPASAGN
jgi:mono/diheme cytochrome c family protein